MKRAGAMMGWTAGSWILVVGSGGAVAVQAQAAETSHIPHSLRDGAPTERLPTATKTRRTTSTQRPTPTPSIRLDSRNPLSPRGAQRSEALLVREIALLQRLTVRTERADPHHADALLRLAYALQELMWIQAQRLHQLQVTGGDGCSCQAPMISEPTAVACAAPALPDTRDAL
jgi:hypothetical protein